MPSCITTTTTLLLLLLSPSSAALITTTDACNFGPTHHSHLVLPLTSTVEECKQSSANFLLSHGATFFCPHTFDVKLLATIKEDEPRSILCDIHFQSLANQLSSKVLLRPTLPAGGLPALARGEMSSWQSPVMYHIHNFGKNNDAGPDAGWNVTTIFNSTTTVEIERVLYGRLLDVQPKPPTLTYLAHNASNTVVLSHYISTSGTSGFDHLLKVDMVAAGLVVEGGDTAITHLRDTWPTYLTIPDRSDDSASALSMGETKIRGILHVYNEKGMPEERDVLVDVKLNYYKGASDGFAGYGTMCPFPLPAPQSTTTCGM